MLIVIIVILGKTLLPKFQEILNKIYLIFIHFLSCAICLHVTNVLIPCSSLIIKIIKFYMKLISNVSSGSLTIKMVLIILLKYFL